MCRLISFRIIRKPYLWNYFQSILSNQKEVSNQYIHRSVFPGHLSNEIQAISSWRSGNIYVPINTSKCVKAHLNQYLINYSNHTYENTWIYNTWIYIALHAYFAFLYFIWFLEFLAHLNISDRLAVLRRPSVPLFVRLSTKFYIFDFVSRTINQTWHKSFLGEGEHLF
jgi:hypothetical protein